MSKKHLVREKIATYPKDGSLKRRHLRDIPRDLKECIESLYDMHKVSPCDFASTICSKTTEHSIIFKHKNFTGTPIDVVVPDGIAVTGPSDLHSEYAWVKNRFSQTVLKCVYLEKSLLEMAQVGAVPLSRTTLEE